MFPPSIRRYFISEKLDTGSLSKVDTESLSQVDGYGKSFQYFSCVFVDSLDTVHLLSIFTVPK
jgi:hypothetical protein